MTSSTKALVTLAVAAAVTGGAAAPAMADHHRPAPGNPITTLDRHRPAPPQGAVPAAPRFDGSHP